MGADKAGEQEQQVVVVIEPHTVLNEQTENEIATLVEMDFVVLNRKKVQLTADQIARLPLPTLKL
jgi:hypothetical protein